MQNTDKTKEVLIRIEASTQAAAYRAVSDVATVKKQLKETILYVNQRDAPTERPVKLFNKWQTLKNVINWRGAYVASLEAEAELNLTKLNRVEVKASCLQKSVDNVLRAVGVLSNQVLKRGGETRSQTESLASLMVVLQLESTKLAITQQKLLGLLDKRQKIDGVINPQLSGGKRLLPTETLHDTRL